jgi:hypothetical protein
MVSFGGENYLSIRDTVADQRVSYDGDNAEIGGVGTIRFKVVPKYNVAPAANRYFFVIQNTSGSPFSQITMFHQSSQNIQIRGQNSGGGAWIWNPGNWSAVLDQEYEFELDLNLSGTSRLFIDGVQFGVSYTPAPVPMGTQDYFVIGGISGNRSDFLIRDFEIYNTVQHTTNFAGEIPRVLTIYSQANPKITPNSPVSAKEITAYSVTSDPFAGSDLIRQTLKVASQEKYVPVATWVDANGTYAETNLPSEIDTNKAALDLSAGAFVYPVSYLHSDDGRSTPFLDTITIGFDFDNPGATPNKCRVYGQVLDNNGEPVEGAEVTVDGEDYYYDDALIARSGQAFTDENGEWEMDVVETATDGTVVNFLTKYTQIENGRLKNKTKPDENKTVPNQPTAALSGLT